MDKMAIYESGRSVPLEAQKAFSNGSFSGTDINPMWRIKKLTELFGPCGIGWYYEVLSERCEVHDSTTIAVVDINLYVKADGEWSKPIYGTGGNQIVKQIVKQINNQTKTVTKVSDEGYKMALTDALSVACKALGIGADIYFSQDKTKYSQYADEVKPGDKVDLPKNENPKGEVKASDTIPAWSPRTAAAQWAHEHGMTPQEFADARNACISAGLVVDIPVKELTKAQLDRLCKAVEDMRRAG